MTETAAEQPTLPAEDQPVEAEKPKKAEKKQGPVTSYVILRQANDIRGDESSGIYWFIAKPVQEARSAKAAVAAYLDGEKEKDGTFVACPVRSWDPITVKTETTTRLVYS